MQVWQWLDGRAEAVRDLCERHRLLLLGAVSLVYFAVTSVLASRKPMWNDELFTYFISQAPTLSGTLVSATNWRRPESIPVLRADSMVACLVRCQRMGPRLPEMIGVWVAVLCLFHIVACQTEGLYGFVAMVFLFVTGANFYSYEARPYGLVLAFSSLAWLFWHIESQPRFFVYVSGGRLGGLNWVLTELTSAPYYIELRESIDDHLLFLVTNKAFSQSDS